MNVAGHSGSKVQNEPKNFQHIWEAASLAAVGETYYVIGDEPLAPIPGTADVRAKGTVGPLAARCSKPACALVSSRYNPRHSLSHYRRLCDVMVSVVLFVSLRPIA